MKNFTLVIWSPEAIATCTHTWRHFSPKYLNTWVLDRLRWFEKEFGPISNFDVYSGIADDFGDWYDLEPVYLDIN